MELCTLVLLLLVGSAVLGNVEPMFDLMTSHIYGGKVPVMRGLSWSDSREFSEFQFGPLYIVIYTLSLC